MCVSLPVDRFDLLVALWILLVFVRSYVHSIAHSFSCQNTKNYIRFFSHSRSLHTPVCVCECVDFMCLCFPLRTIIHLLHFIWYYTLKFDDFEVLTAANIKYIFKFSTVNKNKEYKRGSWARPGRVALSFSAFACYIVHDLSVYHVIYIFFYCFRGISAVRTQNDERGRARESEWMGASTSFQQISKISTFAVCLVGSCWFFIITFWSRLAWVRGGYFHKNR